MPGTCDLCRDYAGQHPSPDKVASRNGSIEDNRMGLITDKQRCTDFTIQRKSSRSLHCTCRRRNASVLGRYVLLQRPLIA